MGRVTIGAALLVLALAVAGGTWWLRSETMTTHEPVPDDSSITVVVDADTRRSKGWDARTMATAKMLRCRLETRGSDLVEGPEEVGDQRFRYVLRPTLDEADQRQLHGCLEDWNVDHVLLDVIELEPSVDV